MTWPSSTILVWITGLLIVTCAMQCDLPNIANGKVRKKHFFAQRRATIDVVYGCKRGFTLVGPPRARCLKGHLIPDIKPVCVRSGCPRRTMDVAHGIVKELVTKAYYLIKCFPGYRHKGGDAAYCDGQNWNGQTPTCEKMRKV